MNYAEVEGFYLKWRLKSGDVVKRFSNEFSKREGPGWWAPRTSVFFSFYIS